MTARLSSASDDVVPIGLRHGVSIQVAPWDAVDAAVSLSIAGMFKHELARHAPSGGLRHLDVALGGAMTRLRSLGIFKAEEGETLTLSAPSPPILAGTVLAIGLGDPVVWTPENMRVVVAIAARETIRLGSDSAAFSPSLLDSGVRPAVIAATPAAMLAGLFDAMPLAGRGPAKLKRWVFCVGADHIDQTVIAFRAAFAKFGNA